MLVNLIMLISQMLPHFIMQYPKITFINVTTNLIRKVWVLESCQAHTSRYQLSKILIFTWNFKFYYWQQILSFVFLEVRGSLCSFFRKCLLNTQVWITVVVLSIILSSKTGVPWKKQIVQLTLNMFKHHTSSFPVF